MSTIETIYQAFAKAYKVSTDSRKIEQDAVFFALKGENFDANDFALQVAEAGVASLVVADRQDLPKHPRIVKVENSLKALQELANHHRKQMKATVLSITGTNGKTTTKELVSAVLAQKYKLIHTIGNLNNHIGVPLTLLCIKPETEMAVVEMGANHPGEIDTLCQIAEPDFGLITNVGKAHLEGFGSFEGVINTKTELYRFIKAKGKAVFVNRANDILWERSQEQSRISYGCHCGADYPVTPCSCNPYLSVKWKKRLVQTHLVGSYNFENVAAAIAVGQYFKVDEDEIVEALETYTPTNSRSQVIETEKNRIIMDAYNANPTSMQAALRNFANICGERHLLILGDMRELGQDSEKEHRAILNLMKELNYRKAFLVGTNFSACNENPDWNTFEKVQDLRQYIENHSIDGKTILVKGSRGIQLEKVLPLL
ncbi:MAG: UDP-N-acetylmuramoyl-tripeptide--D-alanyl-D-alanine ligase [Bacteroidales bacterium]|nr:UDP-N-acetylmuramoyl-tripeptide--D-alanyl-D-alanine ligase [Bacteroidales bacterium]